MEFIDSEKIDDIEKAREVIDTLQSRTMTVEQALEDLARSMEIAAATGQMHLTDSFRAAAEILLKDKITLPMQTPDDDFKVTIIQ